MKVEVIPVVVGDREKFRKGPKKKLKELEIRGRVGTIADLWILKTS